MALFSNTTIYLVEDEPDVRMALQWSLASLGSTFRSFERPSQILQSPLPNQPGCLIVDLKLPEIDGIQLLGRLRDAGWRLPFVIVSGYGDVAGAVSAMQLGASDFIEKPVDADRLLATVSKALAKDRDRMQREAEQRELRERLDSLTPRENQVLELVVQGRLSKQIASQLGVSVKTIETHRSNLTKKLRVDSVAQLVRVVIEARQNSKSDPGDTPNELRVDIDTGGPESTRRRDAAVAPNFLGPFSR